MPMLKEILRRIIIFYICGICYYGIELLYRGYSHTSMFVLAGICGVFFIDTPNNIYSFDLDYRTQVLISTFLCTIAEGVTGVIVNKTLGLGVWDYSGLCGTFFYGQCNVIFVFAWIVIVGFLGIPICDAINYYWFKIDPCPYYRVGNKVIEMKERKN